MYTQEAIDVINSRDRDERAGAGGITSLLSHLITPQGEPPRRTWTLTCLYSDFSTRAWAGERGRASEGLA